MQAATLALGMLVDQEGQPLAVMALGVRAAIAVVQPLAAMAPGAGQAIAAVQPLAAMAPGAERAIVVVQPLAVMALGAGRAIAVARPLAAMALGAGRAIVVVQPLAVMAPGVGPTAQPSMGVTTPTMAEPTQPITHPRWSILTVRTAITAADGQQQGQQQQG